MDINLELAEITFNTILKDIENVDEHSWDNIEMFKHWLVQFRSNAKDLAGCLAGVHRIRQKLLLNAIKFKDGETKYRYRLTKVYWRAVCGEIEIHRLLTYQSA